MKANKMLLGLLAGLAIGATLGVILAPAKGSTTLRRVTRRGEELVDDVKEGFDDFISGLVEEEAAPARRTQTKRATAKSNSR